MVCVHGAYGVIRLDYPLTFAYGINSINDTATIIQFITYVVISQQARADFPAAWHMIVLGF